MLSVVKSFYLKHPYLSSFGVGLTSYFAFAPYFVLPFFWFSLAFVWLLCHQYPAPLKVCKIGYTYAFGFFIGSIYWVGYSFLDTHLLSVVMCCLASSTLSAWFALFYILPFLIWSCFKEQKPWHKILAFAATWVLCEWLQNLISPTNMVGAMLSVHPVMFQFASVGGIYLLSFINIIFAGTIYVILKKRYANGITVFVSLLTLILLFGFLRLHTYIYQPSNIKIRLVQPSPLIKTVLNPPYHSYVSDMHIDLTAKANLKDVNLVIWGESALNIKPENSPSYKNKLKQIIPQNGYLITGISHYETQNLLYDSLWAFDENVNKTATYNKYHLVPYGGEYLPFRKYLPGKLKNIKNISKTKIDFTKGDKYKNITLPGYPTFGALICYDIMFSNQIVSPNNRPSWLLVLSNSAHFADSNESYHQLAALRIRAVEEGLTILQSSKFGISALVEPTGKIQASLGLGEKNILDVYLPENTSINSLYAYTGNTPVLILMLILLLFLIKKRK